MTGLPHSIAHRALLRVDPEQAHTLSLAALKIGLGPRIRNDQSPLLSINLAGLTLPNPVGLAAGYDKNGEVSDATSAMGFGFVEVGSITPVAQAGNPKPRIFRLPDANAVINRLGFNNAGIEACARNLRRAGRQGVVGVNVGANKDTVDKAADYVTGIEALAPFASYFTANISSPNTPGLRDLQHESQLTELLHRCVEARDLAAAKERRALPLFVKIAPDLKEEDLDSMAGVIIRSGIDGVIVSNTTLSRHSVSGFDNAQQAGGLSGAPLFERSTIVLAKMRQRLGADIAIIGVGGVSTARQALEKIKAGANAVQLYTGLIYGGPKLVGDILAGLGQMVGASGVENISALRSSTLEHWAGQRIPE
jgi:dihydroorotate dehydrogenase